MIICINTGWWLSRPSEKYEFVSWDDDIPTKWEDTIHVPNHQPEYVYITAMDSQNHQYSG